MPSTRRPSPRIASRRPPTVGAPAPPRGILRHHIAGRARFCIASKRRDAAYFDRLSQQLGQCPGVQAVQTQPLTASVLVHYSGSLANVVEYAKSHSLFALARAKVVPLSKRASRQLAAFDHGLLRASGGAFDLAGLVFIGLVVASMRALLAGNMMRALSLLPYAVAALLVRSPADAFTMEAEELVELAE